MTALAADRQTPSRANGAIRTRSGDVAAGAVIWLGALIARNAGGFVVPASDAAALTVVGISDETVDNSLGANGALEVTYSTNVDVQLDNAGGAIVQASKGGPCYVADDCSVTTSAVAVHDVLAGYVVDFTATEVWVHVDEALQSAVLAAPLDGSNANTVANASISPAQTVAAIGGDIPIDHANHATETILYVNAQKIEVIGITVIKDQADAGGMVQLTDSADAAISNAIAADTDKTVTRAGTLDKLKRTIAAGAGFKIVYTRGAGNSASQVFLHVINRA